MFFFPSVFRIALGKEFVCRVPEGMHLANIKTLGKFEVSGSVSVGSEKYFSIGIRIFLWVFAHKEVFEIPVVVNLLSMSFLALQLRHLHCDQS